jgi:predicted TIM-barrel fold metal-dependent hydrolase
MSGPWNGPIVDAHQHFWDPALNFHPWLSGAENIPFRYGDYGAIKRAYLPPDYRADAAGHDICKTVYVEAEWDPRDPIGETRYVTGLARREGLPNAIVAQAWLDRDDAATVLRAQADFPLVRSIRQKPGGARTAEEATGGVRSLMSDRSWRRGFEVLAGLGLAFDLQTPWWHLGEATRLADDFPNTTIILNHAGLPGDRAPDTLARWRDAMAGFATRPNGVVKISGLGQRDRPWTVADNAEVVRTTIALFSTARVMFASNFPVDRLCASFDTIYAGFKAITADFPAAEQRMMFHDTACRIYRLDD